MNQVKHRCPKLVHYIRSGNLTCSELHCSWSPRHPSRVSSLPGIATDPTVDIHGSAIPVRRRTGSFSPRSKGSESLVTTGHVCRLERLSRARHFARSMDRRVMNRRRPSNELRLFISRLTPFKVVLSFRGRRDGKGV